MIKSSWLRVLFLISAIFIFISGCGGSSGDKSSSTPQTITGQLIDSAVSGVHYACSSGASGTTNSSGEYTCNEGDTVIFSIGSISFPPVTAVEIVTPLILAGSEDTSNNVVINISRFLQTLDSDNDPTKNGITIDKDTADALDGKSIDFAQSVSEFETDFEEINDNIPGTPTLISQESAIDHLNVTLGNGCESVSGTWSGTWVDTTCNCSDGVNSLDNDEVRFVITQSGCNISLDMGDEEIVSGTINGSDLTGSLSSESFSVNLSLSLNGDGTILTGVATWEDDKEGVQCSGTSDISINKNDIIVGSWGVNGVLGINEYIAINFYPNGTYIHTEADVVQCGAGGPTLVEGVEYGYYTYNASTNVLTTETIYDENGCVGFNSDTFSLSIDGDSFVITAEGEGDYVFERLVDESNPIVGSWGTEGVTGINDYFLLNFYSNGTYILAQSQISGECEPENLSGGIEYGNYTYNSSTNVLTTETIFDKNGCVGFDSGTYLLSIDGDSFVLTVEGEGQYGAERLK